MASRNKSSMTPGAKQAIDKMKYEIASELGVNLGADASSRQNGKVGGEMTTWQDKLRSEREKYAAAGLDGSDGVVHLVTEYNEETGEELTSSTVYAPENIGNFVKWAYARLSDLTKLMEERSQKFQITVEGHPLNRHTPLERQKVYIFSKFLEEINARGRHIPRHIPRTVRRRVNFILPEYQ